MRSASSCRLSRPPGPQRRGYVIRTYLAAALRHRDPHLVINDRDWLARGPVIVANSRWVPLDLKSWQFAVDAQIVAPNPVWGLTTHQDPHLIDDGESADAPPDNWSAAFNTEWRDEVGP